MGGALGAAGSPINLGGYIYGENQKGSSVFLGARWNLNDTINFVAEYIRQSFGNAPGASNTYLRNSFYDLIGHGKHFYFNKSFDSIIHLGLGFFQLSRESSFDGGFAYNSNNSKTNSVYAITKIEF